MGLIEPIKVTGLKEFTRDLGKLNRDLPKVLRVALNEAADVVVGQARSRVPVRSGRAAKSIKPKSTRTAVRVSGGGNRVSYYGWLEFGGAVGRKRSVRRAFLKEGRYIYAAYFDHQKEFAEILEKSLVDVATQAGVGVE